MTEQPEYGGVDQSPPAEPVAEPELAEPAAETDAVTVEKTVGDDAAAEAMAAEPGEVPADPTMIQQPIGATANETPTMPGGAQAAAAKAHALYGHLIQVAKAAQAELERYVPPELLSAAEREAGLLIRSIL